MTKNKNVLTTPNLAVKGVNQDLMNEVQAGVNSRAKTRGLIDHAKNTGDAYPVVKIKPNKILQKNLSNKNTIYNESVGSFK